MGNPNRKHEEQLMCKLFSHGDPSFKSPLLHGSKPANHLVLVDVDIPLITQQTEVGQSGLFHGQMQTAFYELQMAETLFCTGAADGNCFINL